MLKQPAAHERQLLTRQFDCDLAIVGGGLAGTCCAITAARAGLRVVLVQDRPILGGNASSEVRLWALGATSHMGSNNRWAREGGVINEILVENLWRNPEGNALLFDALLLEKVVEEPNITLLLNSALFECESEGGSIRSARAFCSQNSTLYEIAAPLWCDASGDGILGFLCGAAFRMGAEARDEFDEKFAPSREYGELLGHSIYFYSKDAGRPVRFSPPSFALEDITRIPRYKSFNARQYGCRLWWIEYGGRLDTVHETEAIKWELWKVVYGVWNHIKNSGDFPEAENLTLEWVGHIPGKRESRRFEGDTMLCQSDLIEQKSHRDAVAFGGWSIDLHPADGIFSERPGCNQWHARGTYQIPYRCLYSRNIPNLFLAGRVISASHVAFGSTRVMATCAHAAQAVGLAAAICLRENIAPRELAAERVGELQTALMRTGQHIPGLHLQDAHDLARRARITASSELRLSRLPPDGPTASLKRGIAQMLPVAAGKVPRVTFWVDAREATQLQIELRTTEKPDNHTPDVLLGQKTLDLEAGENQPVVFDFEAQVESPRSVFYCLRANEAVAVRLSEERLSGVLSLGESGTQAPPDDIGVDAFERWIPGRRPNGHNLACEIEPPLALFEAQNVCNGLQRPTCSPNVWLAEPNDKRPTLSLRWDENQTIARVELFFDVDYDHAMESVLWGHPERAAPFCVKHFRVLDGAGRVLHEEHDNHQARGVIRFAAPIATDTLHIELLESWGEVPAALFEVRCYQTDEDF